MTQELLNICNKINAELQAERKLSRIALIQRCFEHDKLLGIDEIHLQANRYYYGNRFDKLYDMNYLALEEFEQKLHLSAEQYVKEFTEPKPKTIKINQS